MATKEQKVVTVNKGATYEAKTEDAGGDKRRVVAFHVDRPRSEVYFSTLGSGREERTDIDTFLNTYELIAQEGEPLPEDKAANEKANAAADKAAEEAPKERAPRLDTSTASPTREGLEARQAARNER